MNGLIPAHAAGQSHSCLTAKTCKGKLRLRTGHESPDGEYSYCSILSLTSALDGGRG